MMAALASAAMPNATIAGTRDSEQVNATDKGYGIDHAVVQDAAGKLYDTFASNTPKGRKRLAGRVRAAQTLMGNRELADWGSTSIAFWRSPTANRRGPSQETFP